MSLDELEGPATPRQVDILDTLEDLRGQVERARIAAQVAAAKAHYCGERLVAVEVAVNGNTRAIATLSKEIADLTSALIKTSLIAERASGIAERASGTNELAMDLANLAVQDKRESIAARARRSQHLWAIVGKASTWLFAAGGLASVLALVLQRC